LAVWDEKRVFQQPQAISLTENCGVVGAMAMLRQ
jgi:hypothetical protein